jgi:uncharacterized cupin superfamily protein
MRRYNVLAPDYDLSSERDGYRWRGARIGQAVGSEEIGVSLYELGDGERSHPYHFHHDREEWAIVLAGTPTVRTPGGERELREGDVICFTPGADGAHQLTGPGTVLILSDNRAPDTAEYPESGKIELGGRVFRLADAVDLWDGG